MEPIDGDVATARLIVDAFLTFGIDTLTGGRQAFVNFTRQALLDEFPTLLPSNRVVVEVLETVRLDAPVLAACRALKEAGYTLALDDVVGVDMRVRSMLGQADVIKVDFQQARPDDLAQAGLLASSRGVTLLAEKVETEEQFAHAVDLGFTRFQGYFFARPHIVEGRDILPSKLSYLRLMREVVRPDLDVDSLEKVLRGDLALTYKLLKYLNSAAFTWRHPITDLRHAIVAVGSRDLRKWVSLISLGQMAADKPLELVVTSMARATFCEQLAELLGERSRGSDLFLTGLFSLLDAIMDRPQYECLADMNLPDDVNDALLEEAGRFGQVLALTRAFEQSNWERVGDISDVLGVNCGNVAAAWRSAMHRADCALIGN
jgi:EAL and modified HD-GYP domain-containing signal transduction protein